MSAYPALTTLRLLLEPLALGDAEQVQPLFARWEVGRYLVARVPWPFPADGVSAYYRDVALPAIKRNAEWHWTIRTQATPVQIIGAISLHEGETNRGFWIAPAWQGQGFATEAADAVTDFWFRVLKMPKLRVTKAASNPASSRISAKQAMRMIGTSESDYVCGRLPTEVWEITAEEWRTRVASAS